MNLSLSQSPELGVYEILAHFNFNFVISLSFWIGTQLIFQRYNLSFVFPSPSLLAWHWSLGI